MASATKALKGVKAVGKVKPDMELGRLGMYTIPDDPKNGTTLVRVWAKHGLDVDLLPEKRTGTHVFMSACRSVETRRGTKGVEVKVDEVFNKADECVYQITRLVRDEKLRVIEHPKAMTLAYDKTLDTITTLGLEDYDSLRGLEDAVHKHFAKNQRTVPGPKIRNAVRDTLLALGAQNLRRKAGGVYFIPRTRPGVQGKAAENYPVLEALQAALEELYADRADFHLIPLVNDESSADMVRKHFTINVAERSRECMERALQRVRTHDKKAVRGDFMANLWNERRKIVGAVDQFDQLVALERSEIDKNIADLDHALEQLAQLSE